jgi:hypothetical protein
MADLRRKKTKFIATTPLEDLTSAQLIQRCKDLEVAIRNCEAKAAEEKTVLQNHIDVFAHFGLAAYHAQSFEMELKTIFLLLLRANNRSLSVTALEQCEDGIDKQTLGRLIRDIRKVVSFDDASVTLIESALENRNRLMHGFYERHATDFLSQTGRETIIRELENYLDSFDLADTVARCVSGAIGKSLGITDEFLQAAVERMKKEAISNEAGKA